MDIEKIRDYIKDFEFKKLFVDGLGWEHSPQMTFSLDFPKTTIRYSCIAQINNVPVLKINSQQLHNFNDRSKSSKMEQLHRELKKKHQEHLLLFQNETSFTLSYFSKGGHVREHSYFKDQSTDSLTTKLASIHIDFEDEPKIIEIGKKLDKAFNTEKVTKRFYQDFKNNHFDFQKHITGIPDEEEKKWYASVILNRLMFIWFLQKKLFCNDDAQYLQTKLEESKQRRKDKYYLEFLTVLFFEGFAKKPKERSEKAKELLGEIDYLNGGLFVPHTIEEKYKGKIQIEDQAFEKTYQIFQQYEWHVEDEKSGKATDKDIDPDVLGYIFEKYINQLQQKSMGAYYTKDEITNYLSRNTIRNCILDKVNQKQNKQFKSIEELLHQLDAPLCKLLLTNNDSILNTLTVLDPAVGSGAFLMATMKELINIYSPIIGKIETLGDRDLKTWLDDFESKHKSIAYGIKKNIILKNLYGVDLMKEATEVCKLRLFLSLVATALDRQELEPLPNIDFNIMHGNSLIGFLKEDGKEQLSLDGSSYTQIKERYNQLIKKYKTKSLSFEKLKSLKNKVNEFLETESSKLNEVLANKCKAKDLKYTEIIDIQSKKKITKKRAVSADDFQDLQPFHWDLAFNEIIDRGGFDVIITNPPWDKVENEDKEFFYKYDSSINKKKISKYIFKQKKEKLLQNPSINMDYLNKENFYLFQRDYFLTFYSYQRGNILNQIIPVKNMDTYRLFLERCFDLLSSKGVLGIVLPSGLCRDDGAIGLRRFIFDNIKIEGLIDFQNQMGQKKGKIFEGVHPQFKFLLLNVKKDKPKDQFPCQFHTRDLKVLENFPEKSSMQQSITEIKQLSPRRDYPIIEFKDPKDREILKKARHFPSLEKKVNNSWNCDIYTAEMNETHESYLFKNQKQSKNDLPLYVGKAIYQYEFNYDLSHVNRYISTKEVIAKQGFPFLQKCFQDYRLVIRTIAGNTNERSLISAIIPKKHFITNSIYGVHIESNSNKTRFSYKYMLLLQAFLNSFVIDYCIRQKVSANINKKYITPLRIPRLTEKDPCFQELVEKSAMLTCIDPQFDELADEAGIRRGGITDKAQRLQIQGEIDAIIAHIYKLTLEEFKYILSTFNTGRNQQRLQTLKKHALEAFKQNNLCKKVA